MENWTEQEALKILEDSTYIINKEICFTKKLNGLKQCLAVSFLKDNFGYHVVGKSKKSQPSGLLGYDFRFCRMITVFL